MDVKDVIIIVVLATPLVVLACHTKGSAWLGLLIGFVFGALVGLPKSQYVWSLGMYEAAIFGIFVCGAVAGSVFGSIHAIIIGHHRMGSIVLATVLAAALFLLMLPGTR